MGVYDSSRTRVAPVFNYLYCRDISGRTWLPGLLSLVGVECPPLPPRALARADWWPREAAVPAPLDLLLWLAENCVQPSVPSATGTDATKRRRTALLNRDPSVLAEARAALRAGRTSKAWCALEGPSQPDVFLETKDLLVVIEGKRTEPGPTTSTWWMPVRHQMLRHIDAAWNARGDRKVVGLMIVDGAEGEHAVPSPWREYRKSLEGSSAVNESLPHRSVAERGDILRAFAGVTTWQAVMDALDVPKEVLIDRVVETDGELPPS
ncbi:MAG: hypothetical protein AB7O28_10675 [Vicinamibacterales bacterium]